MSQQHQKQMKRQYEKGKEDVAKEIEDVAKEIFTALEECDSIEEFKLFYEKKYTKT